MIHLERIRRQFGPRVLFDELSWMIPPGARLGLVGPNGVGKTTLLRILEGRDQPDAGAVHRARGLQVGYLPQEVETVAGASVLAVVLGGFAELAPLEAELAELEQALARRGPTDAEAGALAERYGALRQRFEQLDGDRLEARARAILTGLGVAAASFPERPDTLSGGWRMRVALARLLLSAPGLLLLDEPTNHLDLEAIAWLEGFLAGYEGAFVVVSHDRYFLNRMVRGVVELERGKLTAYAGNYDDYVAQKEARRETLAAAAKQQAREVARTQRFIERFRYKASKARQVQSRIRALGKVERIALDTRRKTIRFGFPPAPRSGDVVVRAERVEHRYGDRVVYRGLDLLLERGDRVALVGPNGAGKSTLLKLLAGRLLPERGKLELGHNVIARYYSQHQVDELDPQATVLEQLERVAQPGERPRLRGLLGAFLFSGEDVDKQVRVLSGGERARLALARLLLHPANLLLLDEPTNHLDIESREMLEDALNEYEGTLVVVSHDRYFVNRVATAIGAVGGGRLELYPGDYDEYLERTPAPAAADATAGHGAEPEGSSPRELQREARRREAEERNRLYRARRAATARLAPLESRIAELEQELRGLGRLQGERSVYSDPQRAGEVGRRKAQAETLLAGLYAEWESLAASLRAD